MPRLLRLAFATTLVILVPTLLRRHEVTGTSMRPTLEPGDRLLVVRTWRASAGDLVVVPDPRRPSRLMVKRVAAVSGNELTVQGDNAEASTDSRTFGDVPSRSVRGRAIYRYYPPNRRGRIGTLRTKW